MDREKWASEIFRTLHYDVLARLIRDAAPARQRAFALAAARLAARITGIGETESMMPGSPIVDVVQEAFEVAELMIGGMDPYHPRAVAAREAAERLTHKLDEIQLKWHGAIMTDAEGLPGYDPAADLRRPAYAEAASRHAAAAAAELTLHEDAIEAAARNLEILARSLGIDYDTQLAIARMVLREPVEPIERDPLPPYLARGKDG